MKLNGKQYSTNWVYNFNCDWLGCEILLSKHTVTCYWSLSPSDDWYLNKLCTWCVFLTNYTRIGFFSVILTTIQYAALTRDPTLKSWTKFNIEGRTIGDSVSSLRTRTPFNDVFKHVIMKRTHADWLFHLNDVIYSIMGCSDSTPTVAK